MAVHPPRVTGLPKNNRPLIANGSLFRAPTIEYVVEPVTRTHQADVYEMKTEDNPEMIIALITHVRLSAGKFKATLAADQSSNSSENTRRMGILKRLL